MLMFMRSSNNSGAVFRQVSTLIDNVKLFRLWSVSGRRLFNRFAIILWLVRYHSSRSISIVFLPKVFIAGWLFIVIWVLFLLLFLERFLSTPAWQILRIEHHIFLRLAKSFSVTLPYIGHTLRPFDFGTIIQISSPFFT